MKTLFRFIGFVVVTYVFFSCDNTSNSYREPKKGGVLKKVKIKRLENRFASIKSISDAELFLKQNASFKEHYMDLSIPQDKQAYELFQLASDSNILKLVDDANILFPSMTQFEDEFSKAFENVSGFYPEFVSPQVNTIVSGFGVSYAWINDYLLIGLDYFDTLTPYKPQQMPGYILKFYKPEYLVPKALYQLSEKYVKKDVTNNTFLDAMLQFGRRRYFLKQMMPHLADSMVMEYTAREMNYVQSYEAGLWNIILDRQLLYKIENIEKVHYIRPRPYINEISKDCPGRIGQYFGWKIVESYMANNPNVSVEELMAEKEAVKIFTNSGFVAKNKEK